jgi:hypothetical protein
MNVLLSGWAATRRHIILLLGMEIGFLHRRGMIEIEKTQ